MTAKRTRQKTKQDMINERDLDMNNAAFAIMMAIRYGRMSDHHRECLMAEHFNLSYHVAPIDDRIEDIVRRHRQREIAKSPGPWPADHKFGSERAAIASEDAR